MTIFAIASFLPKNHCPDIDPSYEYWGYYFVANFAMIPKTARRHFDEN
jgi:hypothetical protein